MNRLLVGFLMICCLCCFRTILSEEQKNIRPVKVVADGIGTTIEEAKLNAIKEAVRKVVGELVDAETIVANNKMVERILVASRASVEKHEILSSDKDKDGIWTVRIKALVHRQPLIDRLEFSGIHVKVFDGSKAATQIIFEKGQDAENIRFLAKYFRDNKFPYSLIDVVLAEDIQTIDKRDKTSSSAATAQDYDNVSVAIRFRVKPNIEKYKQFRDGLKVILDKLAVHKFPVSMVLSPERDAQYLTACPNAMCGQKSRYNTFKTSNPNNILLMIFQSQSGKLTDSK